MLTPQLTPRPYHYPQHIGLLWVNRFRTKWFPPASLDSAPSCCEELGTRGRALLPPPAQRCPEAPGPARPNLGGAGAGSRAERGGSRRGELGQGGLCQGKQRVPWGHVLRPARGARPERCRAGFGPPAILHQTQAPSQARQHQGLGRPTTSKPWGGGGRAGVGAAGPQRPLCRGGRAGRAQMAAAGQGERLEPRQPPGQEGHERSGAAGGSGEFRDNSGGRSRGADGIGS